MGVTWSSVSECLGDFSHSHSRQTRLPPSRRLAPSAPSRNPDRQPALRQRYISDDKLTLSAPTPPSANSPSVSAAALIPPAASPSCTRAQQQHHHQQTTHQARHLRKHSLSAPARPGALSVAPMSGGAAVAPPPPPLVPDSAAVYDLLADEDEDVCPTCLEPYTPDNPKITTSCDHSFHLQCIVAWETRSGNRFCPVCATPMEYDEAG